MGCCCCNCPSDFGNVEVTIDGVVTCGCINNTDLGTSGDFSLSAVNGTYLCIPDGGISGVWRYSFDPGSVVASVVSYPELDCQCGDPPPDPCPSDPGDICGDSFNGVLFQCFDGIWTVYFNLEVCVDGAPFGLVFQGEGVCPKRGDSVDNTSICALTILGWEIGSGGTATITW